MCFLQFQTLVLVLWSGPASRVTGTNGRLAFPINKDKKASALAKKNVEAIHPLPGGGGHRRHYAVPYVGNTYCSIMKEEASDGQAFPITCGDGPQVTGHGHQPQAAAAGHGPPTPRHGEQGMGGWAMGRGPPKEVALDEEGTSVANWGYARFCEPSF